MKPPTLTPPNSQKSAIFIGYRRDDIALARQLWQALVHRFGEDEVFFDLERLEGGDDFREELRAAIEGADVFLTVVGPGWVSEYNLRRLHDEADIVRREIELALSRRAEGLQVLPVAMGNAIRIPDAKELPKSLAPWTGLHFETLDQGPAYSTRLEEILSIVDKHCRGLLARKANDWLLQGLADPALAKTRFGQDIAVLAPDSRTIRREAAHAALDDWWRNWPRDRRPFVLLGEEGDGKSWALADWLAQRARAEGERTPLLYVYTKWAGNTDMDQLLELGLNGPSPRFALKDWLADPPERRPGEAGPDFLLVVDALNEHPGLGWLNLFRQAHVAPWAGRIAVIALCRPHYWQKHLAASVGETVATWTLGRYDERELNQALSARGRHRGEFRDEVLALMAKPRYFDMALHLHKRLPVGEITIEMLIYESWREMYEAKQHNHRPFGHDEFLNLIRDLAEPYLKSDKTRTRDIPTLIPPGPWQSDDILQDILSARIATENNGRLHIAVDYLALGLGLLLAVAVEESESDDQAVLDEVIAKQFHDRPDMDIHSRVCGMALHHAMVKRDYPEAGRFALLRAWLDSRNIEQADLEVIAAYLPLRPKTYLDMAGYIWGETNDRAAQDVFMAGLLEYAEVSAVREALVPAFVAWLGLVHGDGHRYLMERDADELAKGRQEVEERLGTPAEPGKVVDLYGYRLMVVRNGGLMRLGQVVAAVLSHPHVDRRPYTQALTTGLVAAAVMGHSEAELAWVCRIAEPEVQQALLDEALALANTRQPTAYRAARAMLHALGSEKAWALLDDIPAEARPPHPLFDAYERDPCGSLMWPWKVETYLDCLKNDQLAPSFIAEQMRELALDPGLIVPPNIEERLQGAVEGWDMTHVFSDKTMSFAQLKIENVEPTLCAFAPRQYAEFLRALAREIPKRQGPARRLLAMHLFGHFPVLGEEERSMLDAAWRDALLKDGDEERSAESLLSSMVLFGRPAKAQFQLTMQRSNAAYLNRYEPHILPLTTDVLPLVKAALDDAKSAPAKQARLVLWYLSQAMTAPDDELRPDLLSLFWKGDDTVRELCLEIFLKTDDRQAAETVIREGWLAQDVESALYEDEMDSWLLCRYGTALSFAEVARRLDPRWWGHAVSSRGYRHGDLADYAGLLDRTWRQIAQLPHEPEQDGFVPELRIDRSGPVPIERLFFKPLHSGDLNVTNYTWGGSAGVPDTKHLKDISDPETLAKEQSAAYRRAVERLDAMHAAGYPWYLDSCQTGLLDKVIALDGVPWREWIAPVLSGGEDGRRLRGLCRGFYEKLCAALLDHEPETGAALFSAVQSRTMRITDAQTHLQILLLDLFAARETPPVSALRRTVLEQCASDRDLFEIVLMAEMGEQSGWLTGAIEAGLASERLFEQTRALALLGFSSQQESGETLARYLDAHSDSWPRQVAEAAQKYYRRDSWARHWFSRFLDEEDRIHAWAAFRLFLRCVDRRYLLWLPEVELAGAAPWKREAYLANRATIEDAAENNEKDWDNSFLGQKEMRDQIWPWMGKYRSAD